MADGEITLKLDDATVARLRDAAAAAGQAVEAYAADIVSHAVEDDFREDRRILTEYERTGEGYSLEEAMSRFEAELLARVPRKK